ncbi:hypothetical protein AC244_17865 [Ensifer adhaerens]|uniref:Uncharacterized protein n=1 Tax=Ensifer adhaerens TaxID=106592 RepID=A0A0L8BS33_ENSAD|nr:hypothetical protein AC244_17865 [Ensifer adhaerens]
MGQDDPAVLIAIIGNSYLVADAKLEASCRGIFPKLIVHFLSPIAPRMIRISAGTVPAFLSIEITFRPGL